MDYVLVFYHDDNTVSLGNSYGEIFEFYGCGDKLYNLSSTDKEIIIDLLEKINNTKGEVDEKENITRILFKDKLKIKGQSRPLLNRTRRVKSSASINNMIKDIPTEFWNNDICYNYIIQTGRDLEKLINII